MAGREYQMAFSIGAKLQNQFGSTFKNAQSSVVSLQNQVEALNRKQGDIAAYQRQQKAIEQTRSKLQLYQQQYANLKASMGEAGEASVDLQNKMLAKEHQIENTTQKLEAQEAQLLRTGNALNEAGIDTGNLSSASKRLAGEINGLKAQQEDLAAVTSETGNSMHDAADSVMELAAALGVTTLLKTAYDELKLCAEEAIAFENSMAAVKRTVGGDDAFLSDLASSFKELSTEIPIATAGLTEIATTAGQLGIAQGDVEQFTTVMAKLATTTDLTANDAATMLAQFANITGLKDYSRLGSVIAELGDATATTASKVVQMSQGMAASASLAGMSSTNIMAISAALGSLGIEAQAGATSMSQMISTLYKATETGEGLKDFASVAGMSAEQFKQAWKVDAVGAMNAFIRGLNDTERNGKSAIVILDELGITNVRQTKAILGLASAGDLLSKTITQANNAWNANTALTEKAQVMYETTQAKITMMNNALSNARIAIGDAFTPSISAGASAMTSLLKRVTEYIEKNPELVRAFGSFAGVIGVATLGLTGYTATAKAAAAASALLQATLGGPVVKAILIATAAIAGIAAGASLLTDAFKGAHKSMEELDAEFDSLNSQIEEQQKIIDLCESYRKLRKELDGIGRSKDDIDAVKTLSEMDGKAVVLSVSAEVAENFRKLTPENFVDGKTVMLSGKEDADNLLEATKFLKGGEDGAWISLDSKRGDALVSAEDLLKDGVVVRLKGDAYEKVAAAGFLADGKNEVSLKGIAELMKSTDFFGGALNDGSILVPLTPDIAKVLDQNKLLAGTTVLLSAKAQANLAADEFMIADQKIVKLKASIDNLPALQASIKELQEQASAANAELGTAKDDLTAMQQRLTELQSRYDASQNKNKDKSPLATEIEALTASISEQETKVGELETAYSEVSTELLITTAAAENLAAKEAELASIKEQLAVATNGVVSASASETEELEKQVNLSEALARAKISELRQQVKDTAISSAKEYAKAVASEAENQEMLNKATRDYNRYALYLKLGADDVQTALTSVFEAMVRLADSDGYDWERDGKAMEVYRHQFEDLLFAISGEKFDFSGSGLAGMSYYVDQEYDAWSNLVNAEADAAGTMQKYQSTVDQAKAAQKAFIDNLVNGVKNGGMTLEQVNGILLETFANMKDGAALAETTMRMVREELDAGADSAHDMADGMNDTKASVEDVNAAISPIITKMEALSEAYQEAYDAAYKSMDGQFKLFEKAPDVTAASMSDMITALQSQQKYISEYAANLELLRGKGINQTLLSQLADGSAESASYVAALVNDVKNNDSKNLDALNAAYASVEESKKAFANAAAEIETDFSTKMKAMQAEFEATVEAMDMSSEAAAAGAATMEAFAKGAEGKLSAVKNAFTAISNVANIIFKLKGYAAGTDNAERGFKMVGEHGPEIVWFNGGETVFNAQETQDIIAGRQREAAPITVMPSERSAGNYHIDFQPRYNISGAMNADELQNILEEHDNRMRDSLEELMDDIAADRERRSYA